MKCQGVILQMKKKAFKAAFPYTIPIGIGFLLIGILIGHHCLDGEAVMLAADAEGLVGLAQIL